MNEHEVRLRDECAVIAFRALMEVWRGSAELSRAEIQARLAKLSWAIADEMVRQRSELVQAEDNNGRC